MPADAQAGLEVIERNARLQKHLIEDLLDLSRIVSGKLHMDVRPVTMGAVVEAAVESIEPVVAAKGMRLVTAIEPDLETVAGDPVRLQQVVCNLLANAVKFTPTGGQISVGLHRVDDHLELTVADSGIGISADFLPYVFDRFRQADGSTTRSFGGLGVGLSIVKQLVESHGGSVRATSRGAQQGATFIVSLPVMPLSGHGAGRHHLADGGGTRPAPDAPSLRDLSVMVVEDDDDSRKLLVAMLQRAGAAVVPVASAAAALLALQRHTPDVIVSDIGLPDQDGYGLIRASSLPAPVGQIPAMALTAYARPEDRRLGDAGWLRTPSGQTRGQRRAVRCGGEPGGSMAATTRGIAGVDRTRAMAGAAGTRGAYARCGDSGSLSVNVVRSPSMDSTSTSPPMAKAQSATMARPRPMPVTRENSSRSAWARVKRRNTVCRDADGMPTPLSSTRTSHQPSRSAGATVTAAVLARLALVAILDGVGQQVDQRQFEPPDVDRGEIWHVVLNSDDLDAPWRRPCRQPDAPPPWQWSSHSRFAAPGCRPARPRRATASSLCVIWTRCDTLRSTNSRARAVRAASRSKLRRTVILDPRALSGWRHSCVARRVNSSRRRDCSVRYSVCV